MIAFNIKAGRALEGAEQSRETPRAPPSSWPLFRRNLRASLALVRALVHVYLPRRPACGEWRCCSPCRTSEERYSALDIFHPSVRVFGVDEWESLAVWVGVFRLFGFLSQLSLISGCTRVAKLALLSTFPVYLGGTFSFSSWKT